jgi:hypothetical protein
MNMAEGLESAVRLPPTPSHVANERRSSRLGHAESIGRKFCEYTTMGGMEQLPHITTAHWRRYASEARERAQSMHYPPARETMELIAKAAENMAATLERLERARAMLLVSDQCREAVSQRGR